MKRALLLTIPTLLLFFAACEKDDLNSSTENPNANEKEYSVIRYKDNFLNAKYVFTETKLLELEIYSDLGELEYSSVFHYHNSQLDSMTRNYVSQSLLKTTTYSYGSNNKLNKIVLRDSSPYLKTYTINYDNSGDVQKIVWNSDAPLLSGEFTIDNYANVSEYKYNYSYSSNVNDYQSNYISFNQFPNVVQRFWVTNPTMEYLSVNNPVEHIQNTSRNTGSGSGSGGTWEYIIKSWDIEYTHNAAGYVLTQTVLDTNNAVVNTYEFEYDGF